MKIELSEDQDKVMQHIMAWASEPFDKLTLGGLAGSGKSTLVAVLRDRLHKKYPNMNVAFVSFTGKAVRVLRDKLNAMNSMRPCDRCSTIHSLIYTPIIEKGVPVDWVLRATLDYDLIICDEASMVTKALFTDLMSFDIPVLFVGDHHQLPPIGQGFNLMKEPELVLTEVHRHALDNPIIKVSGMARKYGSIPEGTYGDTVKKFKHTFEVEDHMLNYMVSHGFEDSMILVGTNRWRVHFNRKIRQLMGLPPETPTVGDRVICLKNNRKHGLYNGMLGTIQYIMPHEDHWYRLKCNMDGEDQPFEGLISKYFFNNETKELPKHVNIPPYKVGNEFDFGYAFTVHKAQGSECKRVLLFDSNFFGEKPEYTRWLYTGVTRAQSELYLIGE